MNLLFLILVAVIVVRFLRTGDRQMLQMMDAVPEVTDGDGGSHAHAH